MTRDRLLATQNCTLANNRHISVITLMDRKVSHWRDYLDPLRVFAALEVQMSKGSNLDAPSQHGSKMARALRRGRPPARSGSRRSAADRHSPDRGIRARAPVPRQRSTFTTVYVVLGVGGVVNRALIAYSEFPKRAIVVGMSKFGLEIVPFTDPWSRSRESFTTAI